MTEKGQADMIMLESKIALVTGASRGIGNAICMKFAQEGATVYAGVRSMELFAQLSWEDKQTGGKIIPIMLDVCDSESIKKCIMDIKKQVGYLDILVNNAGITIIERFDMTSDTSIDKVYSTNVYGLMHVTQMAVKLLKKSAAPNIINMSSILAGDSDIGQTVYASSKAAVVSMTKTWAKEYAPLGFRVNAIAPGNVDTDMFNVISESELEKAVGKIGLGRVASTEEIANVALFLASAMSSYITGEVINVNGGLVL